MPDLTTSLHLDMLREFRPERVPVWKAAQMGYATRQTLDAAIAGGALTFEAGGNGVRLVRIEDLHALYGQPSATSDIYGLHWGDPDVMPPLKFVKDRYLLPWLSPRRVGVEIGPGGGRWTRYMLKLSRLYAVDFHQENLDELKRHYDQPNIVPILNNGDDFPGVPDGEVDFLFSFGVFVHLEPPIIGRYLENMQRILKPGAAAVIHYADKTKIMARENPSFSENTPDIMRRLVSDHGFTIGAEDTTTLWHSSIVIFTKPA